MADSIDELPHNAWMRQQIRRRISPTQADGTEWPLEQWEEMVNAAVADIRTKLFAPDGVRRNRSRLAFSHLVDFGLTRSTAEARHWLQTFPDFDLDHVSIPSIMGVAAELLDDWAKASSPLPPQVRDELQRGALFGVPDGQLTPDVVEILEFASRGQAQEAVIHLDLVAQRSGSSFLERAQLIVLVLLTGWAQESGEPITDLLVEHVSGLM